MLAAGVALVAAGLAAAGAEAAGAAPVAFWIFALVASDAAAAPLAFSTALVRPLTPGATGSEDAGAGVTATGVERGRLGGGLRLEHREPHAGEQHDGHEGDLHGATDLVHTRVVDRDPSEVEPVGGDWFRLATADEPWPSPRLNRDVPDERFAEHLSHPVGRGHAPAGAYAGAAGGAACGDLVTIRLTVAGERVTDAGFEASGCGAALAAASAAVELVRGASIFDAARVGTAAIAEELGGLSVGKLHAADLAADALHQALGAAVAHEASAPPSAGRTLIAMSGGVDSTVAAVLLAGTHDEVVAVTLELWRDPENDAEASCCSASAVRSARAIAHRIGLPHFTLDLRAGFRAGVVDRGWPSMPRA